MLPPWCSSWGVWGTLLQPHSPRVLASLLTARARPGPESGRAAICARSPGEAQERARQGTRGGRPDLPSVGPRQTRQFTQLLS